MKIVSQNDGVLCRKLKKQEDDRKDFLLYSKDEFPSYEVVNVGKAVDSKLFKEGDEVVCNSIGSKFKFNDEELYMFKQENIIGKVK